MPTARPQLLDRVLRALGLRPRNRGGPSARSGHAAETGAWGEREAERWLKSRGYAIIGRNVATQAGEADLVCRASDGRTMVVVEVKSRLSPEGGGVFRPEHAINASKRRRLLAIARVLARANRWGDRPVRVDVIAVERLGDRLDVRHHEGIGRLRA